MFSDIAASTCMSCTSGHSCFDGIDYTSPDICPVGTYSAAGQLTCLACDAGLTSDQGASSCSLCPAGNECSMPSSPTTCSSGEYTLEGQVGKKFFVKYNSLW